MLEKQNKWEKRFTWDLITDTTPVPNLLLKYFRELGLSEAELVLLIQIFMFKSNGNDYPSVEEICEHFNTDVLITKQTLASLIEKGFVIPASYMKSRDSIVSHYVLDGLYDKLMEIWALEMACNNANKQNSDNVLSDDAFALIYNNFEKEFGRPLSPMEKDKILEWLDKEKYDPSIILESLKRTILRGIYNFNYIDKILLEWRKSNIRTVNEVASYEEKKVVKEQFPRKKTVTVKKNKQNFNNLYEL